MLQDYGRPPILYCDQCTMYNHFNPIILSHITTRTQLSSIISLSHLILSMKGIGGRGVQCGRSLSHCCCWSWYACFACTTTLMAGECRSLFCLDGFNSAWQNHNPSFFFRNPHSVFQLHLHPPLFLVKGKCTPLLLVNGKALCTFFVSHCSGVCDRSFFSSQASSSSFSLHMHTVLDAFWIQIDLNFEVN